jgi:hypothetical protein
MPKYRCSHQSTKGGDVVGYISDFNSPKIKSFSFFKLLKSQTNVTKPPLFHFYPVLPSAFNSAGTAGMVLAVALNQI